MTVSHLESKHLAPDVPAAPMAPVAPISTAAPIVPASPIPTDVPADPEPSAIGQMQRSTARRALLVCGGLGVSLTAFTWRVDAGLAWFVAIIVLIAAIYAAYAPRRPSVLALGWTGLVLINAAAYVLHASDWASRLALPTSLLLTASLPLVLSRRPTMAAIAALPESGLRVCAALPSALGDARRLPVAGFADSGPRVRAMLPGILLGLPIAMVFAGLLWADRSFANLVERLATATGSVPSFAGSAAWSSAGVLIVYLALRRAMNPSLRSPRTPEGHRGIPWVRLATSVRGGAYRAHSTYAPAAAEPRRWITPTAWVWILGQVVMVFALFAVANAPNLFQGHAFLQTQGTVTYAGHLHQGFYQLTFATLLSLILVVAGQRALRGAVSGSRAEANASRTARPSKLVRGFELALLGLTGIAWLSCFQRSVLYEQAYGLTYLRLLVFFSQLGMALAIVLVGAATSCPSWRGFRAAIVLSGVGLLTFAASIDADLTIAKRTVDRLQHSSPSSFKMAELDTSYLARLSDDALPVLAHPYFQNHPQIRHSLESAWQGQAKQRLAQGWRAWRGVRALW